MTMIRKINLLLIFFIVLLFSCQRPFLEQVPAEQGQFYYTQNVSYDRANYIDAQIAFPLSVVKDKSINGTVAGMVLPVNDQIIFATANGFLYTMEKGSFRNSANFRPVRGISTAPTYFNGRLYIPSEWNKTGFSVYDLLTREIVWELENSFSVSSPVIWRNKIFHVQKDGHIFCFDESVSQEIWHTELEDQIINSLAFDRELIFAATLQGKVIALVPESGAIAWQTKLQEPIHATPVLSKDMIIIVTVQGNLFLLSKRTGKIIFTKNMQVPLFTTPSTDGMHFYICASNGRLTTFNLKTHSIQWERQLEGSITVPALILNDKIVVGTDQKFLYVLNKEDGTILQKLELEGRLRTLPLPHRQGLIIGYEYRKLAFLKGGKK